MDYLSKQITFRIYEDEYNQIKLLAEQNNHSIADEVRRFILEILESPRLPNPRSRRWKKKRTF